jgi:uncharacterized protein
MSEEPLPPKMTGLRRALFVVAGLVFVGIGGLGVVLPVLPTTPFLLLASYCFVRSSPRLNRWLLRNRVFGPFLRDWQRHRGVRLHVKIAAVLVLILGLGISLALVQPAWPWALAIVGLGMIGLIVVLRLPRIKN